jgi:hypothetical protein
MHKMVIILNPADKNNSISQYKFWSSVPKFRISSKLFRYFRVRNTWRNTGTPSPLCTHSYILWKKSTQHCYISTVYVYAVSLTSNKHFTPHAGHLFTARELLLYWSVKYHFPPFIFTLAWTSLTSSALSPHPFPSSYIFNIPITKFYILPVAAFNINHQLKTTD